MFLLGSFSDGLFKGADNMMSLRMKSRNLDLLKEQDEIAQKYRENMASNKPTSTPPTAAVSAPTDLSGNLSDDPVLKAPATYISNTNSGGLLGGVAKYLTGGAVSNRGKQASSSAAGGLTSTLSQDPTMSEPVLSKSLGNTATTSTEPDDGLTWDADTGLRKMKPDDTGFYWSPSKGLGYRSAPAAPVATAPIPPATQTTPADGRATTAPAQTAPTPSPSISPPAPQASNNPPGYVMPLTSNSGISLASSQANPYAALGSRITAALGTAMPASGTTYNG